MINSSPKLAALTVALLLASCAQQRTVLEPGAGQRLEQRQAEFFAAQAARDPDRLAALFAEDAVLQIANMPQVTGREEIHRIYSNIFRFLVEARVEPQQTEVAESGDMAYSLGSTVNAFSGPEGLQEFPGKYALIWQQVRGDWQVVLYSVSSDAR
jgi:uncharacterized protein (TIGR02246 family)